MSGVTVSMKMSAKQAGKLYMKCIQLEDRVKELIAQEREAFEAGYNARDDGIFPDMTHNENIEHAWGEYKDE